MPLYDCGAEDCEECQREFRAEGCKITDTRTDAEIKAFNLHTALQSLLYSYTKLVKVTNSEPTFGEAPGVDEANKALYENRPLADWEPPAERT